MGSLWPNDAEDLLRAYGAERAEIEDIEARISELERAQKESKQGQ